jgi:hypothetical protein
VPSLNIGVIDTSSIIEIRRFVPKAHQSKVYADLGKRVKSDVLVFPKQVYTELDRHCDGNADDKPHEWAKDHKAHACRHAIDPKVVRRVLASPGVAQVIDPDKAGVEEADVYVLALADLLKVRYNVLVIAEEIKDRLDKISIATACGLLGIPCLRVAPYLRREGIWPS